LKQLKLQLSNSSKSLKPLEEVRVEKANLSRKEEQKLRRTGANLADCLQNSIIYEDLEVATTTAIINKFQTINMYMVLNQDEEEQGLVETITKDTGTVEINEDLEIKAGHINHATVAHAIVSIEKEEP
jgi:hypothetical protein